MSYSIQIFDTKNNKIGELMKASASDVLKFLSKGLKVIDKSTGVELTEDIINQSIGVSDGMIDIG